MKRLLVAALGLGLLAGCQSTQEANDFAVAQTALAGSKAMQREVSKECVNEMKVLGAEDIRMIAVLLDTTKSKALPLLCSRIVTGMANGDLTYQDYKASQRGGLSPKVVRVMQGTN
ncbi:hypothetical protein K7H91_19945 [Martelella mediterranea]|uniref:hypothetical protein n=1 Tax=Martelella mediterranea TaxID=293089 RepID=UPI001E4D9EDB|nr:hypothetical protein [Martelella mediterranea]MCD1636036.1 hypothetical protein [Martelella mediterranea]